MDTSSIKTGLFICMLLGWLLLPPSPALAHKVTVFAWVEDGQVHTESKFSGGKRVKEGTIEVFDHQDAKVLEGKTDAQGYFAFPVPDKAEKLKIVLKAGMGHGNHWIINAQELGVASSDETQTLAIAPPAPLPSAPPMALDTDTVEQIVENALDKKLAPIKARMADQAWGLRDILGGLGYILGLVGLAGYIQSRKQRTTKP